jgi:AcrR family transcriptional regulator
LAQEPSDEAGPRRRRRKQARPAEIIAAALDVFADRGFAAARLEDIARRAGVVKGSIYLYFSTKEELFGAVVRSAIVPDMEMVRGAADAFDGSLAELAPRVLAGAAAVLSRPSVAGVARMVIGESRNFPDLARIWHDEVVSPVIDTVARAIARAQERGEVREDDPWLHAFSLLGPLITAMLFREVFGEVSSHPPDLVRLAEQHGRTILHGLLATPSSTERS